MRSDQPVPPSRRAFPLWSAVLLGLTAAAMQVTAAVVLQDRKTVKAAYRTLYRWDSEHYLELAENGYRSSLPMPVPEEYTGRQRIRGTNVAFFPAYPLLSRAAFSVAGGMRHSTAMTILSQLLAAGFWVSLTLLLRRWGAGPGISIVAVLAVLAHPAAFFLVVPYSESLFLLSLLLLFLCSEVRGAASAAGAALAGVTLTATRLFGLPFCAWPLAREWAAAEEGPPPERRRLWRALAIGAAGTLGAGTFFAYCQYAFGAWNLYFLRQRWGWGIESDLLALPKHAHEILFGGLNAGGINSQSVLMTALTLWMLLAVTCAEALLRRAPSAAGWRLRYALLLFAWISYTLPFSALWHTGLQSMLRYVLLTHLLLVLWGAVLAARVRLPRAAAVAAGAAILVIAGVSAGWQISLFLRFSSGGWVA